MIVDISKKPDVYRYAKATIELDVERCNTAVALRAALEAYRYLPFLHPLPLTTSAYCVERRLYVEGLSQWQTGVEMDVLFGALAGAVASGATLVRDLTVEKIKGVPKELTSARSEGFVLERAGDLRATAYGEMAIRNFEMVKRPVEKGHPLYAAQTAAALNVKRLCELVGGPCPHIQYFKIEIDVAGGVAATVEIKARDLSPAPEALFAVGAAFLTIWDMLKKFEKDEGGQYPQTRVIKISTN